MQPKKGLFPGKRLLMFFFAAVFVVMAAASVYSQTYPIVPLQSLSQVVGQWSGEVNKAALAQVDITFTFTAGGKFIQEVGHNTFKGKARAKNGKLVLYRKGEVYAELDFHQGSGGQELSGYNSNGGQFLISRNVTASAPPPASASSSSSASTSSGPAAGGDGFLTEGGIKTLLVGKTIKFDLRGRVLVIFFKDDSSLESTVEGSGRIFEKDWLVKNGNIFCRKFGRQNKSHCARLKKAGDGKVTFVNPKGKFTYTASLLDGRKLPE